MNFFNRKKKNQEYKNDKTINNSLIDNCENNEIKPSIQSEPCSIDDVDSGFFEEVEDESLNDTPFNRNSLFSNPYSDEVETIDKNTENLQYTKTKEIISNENIEKDVHNEDKASETSDAEIYGDLFSETTVVGTQIYSKKIDDCLGGYNYSSNHSYRVGYDSNDIGSIFTITRKDFDKPYSFSRAQSDTDIDWYNELAALGNSFAAVKGTTVQGIAICEPQLWNNTLNIHYITVTKEDRNQGIGNMLLEHCVQHAREHGYRAICVEVLSKNGYAVDFFKKRYFNIVGTNIQLYSNSDLLKGDVGIFMQRTII